jgi:hypothetical protein
MEKGPLVVSVNGVIFRAFTVALDNSGGQKRRKSIGVAAMWHVRFRNAIQNVSGALSFQHIRGKACGKHRKIFCNWSKFNVMIRIAPS